MTRHPREAVVLLHGLWMGAWAMVALARRLEAAGFDCRCYSYPTLRLSLDENVARLGRHLAAQSARPLHLVGHSLGGVVVLKLLLERADVPPGRVVLLGSPLTGCHTGARLTQRPGGATLLGRSIGQWLTAPTPRWDGRRELGVIAGSAGFGMGRLVAPALPRPNDGAVAVAETELPGAAHTVLPVTHSGMLVSRRVAEATARFLRRGRFDEWPGA